jgi:hypothetical protein
MTLNISSLVVARFLEAMSVPALLAAMALARSMAGRMPW